MRIIKNTIILALIILISCNSKDNDVKSETINCKEIYDSLNFENQVIWTVIQSEYIHPNDTIFNKKGEILHIFKTTYPRILIVNETIGNTFIDEESDLKELQEFGLPNLNQFMISEYCNNNESVIKVGPFPAYKGRITYMTFKEFVDINWEYSINHASDDDYLPGSGHGMPTICFSRPGFNEDKTKAIIEYSIPYAECASLLELQNGCWKIIESTTFLII